MLLIGFSYQTLHLCCFHLIKRAHVCRQRRLQILQGKRGLVSRKGNSPQVFAELRCLHALTLKFGEGALELTSGFAVVAEKVIRTSHSKYCVGYEGWLSSLAIVFLGLAKVD